MVLVTSRSGRPCEGLGCAVACSPSSAGVPVVWSFLYLALRHVLELIMLCCRSAEAKEIEILVLRHELTVLRRQHPRPRLQPKDRALLAALSRQLPRARWSVFLVKPETLLGWHRRMVRRRWTYALAPRGRPPVPDPVQQLILRFAWENPRWATSGSAANCSALAARSRPAPSDECSAPAASIQHPGVPRPLGGRSSAGRRRASWPATSSPSGCGDGRCCSSSNLAADGCTWPVSPPTRPARGWPNRPAISSWTWVTVAPCSGS
jgi:hypothetical protein